MGKREGVFCDIPIHHGFGEKQVTEPCPRLSIDACVICDRDICQEHSFHPRERAIQVEIKLIAFKFHPGDPPPGQPRQGETVTANRSFHLIPICRPCGDEATAVLSSVTTDVAQEFAAHLRAALTARRLSSK